MSFRWTYISAILVAAAVVIAATHRGFLAHNRLTVANNLNLMASLDLTGGKPFEATQAPPIPDEKTRNLVQIAERYINDHYHWRRIDYQIWPTEFEESPRWIGTRGRDGNDILYIRHRHDWQQAKKGHTYCGPERELHIDSSSERVVAEIGFYNRWPESSNQPTGTNAK